MLSVVAAALALAPSWEPLFNGYDLSEFTVRGGLATYSVKNGTITGTTKPNSPNTFLCTDKEYGDFELELEFKTAPTLNSGIQDRSGWFRGYKNGAVHGYPCEIDPTESGWTGGLYDEYRRGWLQDLTKNDRGRRAFRQGEWNKVRISFLGNHFRSWVNGVACADFRDDLTQTGFIAFQVHGVGDNADPLTVQWRNVKIKDYGTVNGVPVGRAPKGAEVMVGGESDLAKWHKNQSSSPNGWKWVMGAMQCVPGSGSIVSNYKHGSGRLHMEFMVDENGQSGQANGNSGVYVNGRYEVQILNSVPRGPLINECGAVYNVKAPDFALARPAGEWQSFDIEFVAPKWDGDKKLTNSRMTVYHNGTLIHKDLEVRGSTAAGNAETPEPAGILLQDHGNNIRFRNIWFLPAP